MSLGFIQTNGVKEIFDKLRLRGNDDYSDRHGYLVSLGANPVTLSATHLFRTS